MNLQEIGIKKLNSLYCDIKNVDLESIIVDENVKMQIQSEGMRLGFIFTEDAIKLIINNNYELYNTIFSVLSELVGANKVWKPFYQNFPNEVFEKSELELYLNAITHYLSGGEWRLQEVENKKIPTFEKVKFKKIGISYKSDIDDLLKSIVSSNGSITEYDKEILEYFVKKGDVDWVEGVNIKFKETLCYFVSLLFNNDIKITKNVISTATDVLRIAVYFSGGDIALSKKTTFKLSNKKRKFVVSLLEDVIKEEEIAKYKKEWIALFHHLHIGSFKNAKKSNLIAKKLRESKIYSTNSIIEESFKRKDKQTLLSNLPKNMGDFGRRLDSIIRNFENSDEFVKLFLSSDNISKVDTRVLLQILSHFKYRNERDFRIVIPKGDSRKATILPNQKEIPSVIIDNFIVGITNELRNRFVKKDFLGKVYIDESLKKSPIPMQMRTASDGLFVMQRGSVLSLNKDKSILRFFIHWIGLDIDLSACFLTDDLTYHSTISYYNLKSENSIKSVHSGDITRAPYPSGACEFIDIDLESIKDDTIRYVAMDVRVFTGGDFQTQCANAGWMMRDDISAKNGVIFDAKTVEQRISISSKRSCIVALFDIKEREVIWLDMEGTSSEFRGGNNVASNKASIKQIAEIAVKSKSISLYDLLKIHTDCRGVIVNNKDEADTIFDYDMVFKYTDILSKYIT